MAYTFVFALRKTKSRKMNAEEMQRKIVDYEQRINEYERRRVCYERTIGRLEDDIFNRDDEIRRAKFTLVEVLIFIFI